MKEKERIIHISFLETRVRVVKAQSSLNRLSIIILESEKLLSLDDEELISDFINDMKCFINDFLRKGVLTEKEILDAYYSYDSYMSLSQDIKSTFDKTSYRSIYDTCIEEIGNMFLYISTVFDQLDL